MKTVDHPAGLEKTHFLSEFSLWVEIVSGGLVIVRFVHWFTHGHMTELFFSSSQQET